MENEKDFLNNYEKEPQHNEVVVDFLRHGEPDYSPESNGLTPEGESQIRNNAEKIVEKIEPDKEKIILWSSLAKRAQGSEEIIKDVLAKKGIEIDRDSEISSMNNFKVKDWDFVKNLFRNEAKEKGVSPEVLYTQQGRDKSNKLEIQEDVKKRAERTFNWIRYVAENANLEGKKLHIIGVSHREFIGPIIEDIFGPDAGGENYIKYGEDLNIKFDYNPQNKEMVISAEFRGQKVNNIVFNKEKRKFAVKQNE
ncbi:MAG: hypothetical protein WC461_00875 [Candidatus Paceibacterota bacterium]